MSRNQPPLQLQAVISTPIGNIGVVNSDQFISHIHFLNDETPLLKPQNQLAKKAVVQIENYFKSAKHQFDLPLQLNVTAFQKKVLMEMCKIPAGETRSYSKIASALNSSPRAVGNACRQNPCPIIIPCHRVVAKHGLGGYSGATAGKNIDNKKWLLQHESV